jgi:hypothetical protein
MTNKHFFEEGEDDGQNCTLRIKNDIYSFECQLLYMPPNIIDIAIFGIKNFSPDIDKLLTPIKLSQNKVRLLDEIYAVNYSYFDKTDILNLKSPSQFVKHF